jgi:hypothetical protein
MLPGPVTTVKQSHHRRRLCELVIVWFDCNEKWHQIPNVCLSVLLTACSRWRTDETIFFLASSRALLDKGLLERTTSRTCMQISHTYTFNEQYVFRGNETGKLTCSNYCAVSTRTFPDLFPPGLLRCSRQFHSFNIDKILFLFY